MTHLARKLRIYTWTGALVYKKALIPEHLYFDRPYRLERFSKEYRIPR